MTLRLDSAQHGFNVRKIDTGRVGGGASTAEPECCRTIGNQTYEFESPAAAKKFDELRTAGEDFKEINV